MISNDARILIIKQSSLGDIVHTLPLVHGLKRKYPGCTIGWVVQKGFASLLKRDEAIDKLYIIDIPSTSEPGAGWLVWGKSFFALVRAVLSLRGKFHSFPYDLVLDLHASFRSGLLAMLNPGGVRVGFPDAREGNRFFQQDFVSLNGATHALEKNLSFARYFGLEVEQDDFFITVAENDRQKVTNFLNEYGLGGGQKIVYANPCARWQSKAWLPGRWASLADRLAEQGTVMVFCGSRFDIEYIKTITRQMLSEPVVAAGKLSLPESVALLKLSGAYIGLDSGPMHMAAMSGTPVVALFGPTHPDRVGPYGVAHRIVRAEGLACLECRRRQCASMECMDKISVEQVMDALDDLLGQAYG